MQATYIAHMGDDLMVVNAARVSFAKHHKIFDDKQDTQLINFLAREGHWTPFAHPQISLHMKAPIFVRTQCFKHKVGFTENEISRRYVKYEPEFYYPAIWRGCPTGGAKQGSSGEVMASYGPYIDLVDQAKEVYYYLLGAGVAPEQARMVLPQGMYTEWQWTGSLAAWARFVRQRTGSGAQEETSELARQVAEIIQPFFPVSWSALLDNVKQEA